MVLIDFELILILHFGRFPNSADKIVYYELSMDRGSTKFLRDNGKFGLILLYPYLAVRLFIASRVNGF